MTMRKLREWQSDAKNELKESDFWLRETSYVSILGIVIGGCLLVANIIQLVKLDPWVNAYGCELRSYTSIVLEVLLVLCALGLLFAWLALRGDPDQYDMKNELIICFIVWVIALVPYLVIYQTYQAGSDYLGLLMFVFIATGYFTSVIRPIYLSYKCPPAESTAGVLETVEEILLDNEGVELMRKVAQLHHGAEMCECALAIVTYRKIEDDAIMRTEAQKLFDLYVKEGALKQCNFPGTIRNQIEGRLETATSDLFNRAFQELVKLLNTNYLREVKNMDEFAKLREKRQKEKEMDKKARDIWQQ
jgi:hypothetical protein